MKSRMKKRHDDVSCDSYNNDVETGNTMKKNNHHIHNDTDIQSSSTSPVNSFIKLPLKQQQQQEKQQEMQDEPPVGTPSISATATTNTTGSTGTSIAQNQQQQQNRRSHNNPVVYFITSSITNVCRCIEDFLFPKSNIVSNSNMTDTSRQQQQPSTSIPVNQRRHCPVPTNNKFLYGCTTIEEHYSKLNQLLDSVNGLSSSDGLRVLGVEYRLVPCDVHRIYEPLLLSPEQQEEDDENTNDVDTIDINIVPLDMRRLSSLRTINGSSNHTDANSNAINNNYYMDLNSTFHIKDEQHVMMTGNDGDDNPQPTTTNTMVI
jgi:hypothetical protein